MAAPLGDVLINGEPVAPDRAAVSVFDVGFQRGYGCFEAMRSYQGSVFRGEQHVERLLASAESLQLPVVDGATLIDWIGDRARQAGDAVIRVFVTGGTDFGSLGTNAKTIVFAEELPTIPASTSLRPTPAPWHSDGTESELTGAKTMSYGPNMAARQHARALGFGDALLVGRLGHVLEGPTYSVGWFTDGAFETPALRHGILPSITRAATVEVAAHQGISVVEGTFNEDRLRAADEVFVMSTIREILPVVRIADTTYAYGPLTKQLQIGFRDLVAAELGPVE